MRHWRFVICGLLLCAYPGLTFSAPGEAHVVLLLSEEGGAYREVADSFIARAQQLAKKIPDVDIKQAGAVALDAWRGRAAPQLVVTVGTRAAQVMFDANIAVPTLRVLIARKAHESLQAQAKGAGIKTAATALYLEQPWLRQFEFVRRVVPKAKHLGAILGPASQHDVVELTNAAMQRGVIPLLRILTAQQEDSKRAGATRDWDAGTVFKDIAEQSDVMLAVPDPTVLTPNSAKWLLYTAYQRGIPVLGFSRSYVSAGALGAVYSTPAQIGQQAAEIALDALQDAGINLAAAVYPKYFSVAINRSVARSLRLEVPDEAELLRQLNAPEVPP